jgi:hypothetical protein
MEIEITESHYRFGWITYYFFLIVYYIAFVWVSYGVFMECRMDRHFWIVCDLINGILGGLLLIYPFNVFRYGFADTFHRLLKWFCIYALLFGLSAMIGYYFGFGGMK